ncbi:MAG TPA: ATP-binding protein [Terriglobales bacterium]|nr:ATP-binding protein [Terriglobales bacterium]
MSVKEVSYNRLVKAAARSGSGYLIAALSVAGITLVGARWLHLNPTTIALAFLLGILGISASWGLREAVFMSVVATVAFDYFSLPPIGAFTIADPQNWIALFAFLVTAVSVSELSARARRGARTAIERRQELERLYAFSQLLLSSDNPAELLNLIPRYIVESFGIRSAAISLSSRADVYRSGPTIDGLESQDLQLISLRGEPRFDATRELAFMPLRMGMRVVGCMGVSGSLLSRQTLEAIGSLVAIAVERAGAVEKLSRAEAARESEQLRSVLLDSVTHEFRTPLTAIKASVTSLLGSPSQSSSHSPEERQELLTIINEESDRLNRLIGEAAEMAQLDANKVEFRFESAPIGGPVEEALREVKQLLVQHPVEVRIPADLPNARMDSAHVKEVLVHLLENAAKYSPAGAPIRITAEAKNNDQMLTINIADRGPGIDDFEQSLVFEKFYRGRNQRVQVHGTGMGLAICKAIVEAHGGRLGVTSQLGHGSVFYFSLPVG